MKNIFLTSLFILVSVLVFAQDDLQSELFSTDLILKYRTEIDLSETQVTNIKNIHDANISEFNSLKWDLDAALVSFNKLLASSKVDKKSSMEQLDKVISLENKLKRIRLEMLINIKNELTATQQTQLKKLRTDTDINGLSVITPINENPRVMVKIDGAKQNDRPLYILRDAKGERKISDINNIKPDNIESLTVLKGEAATKQYGEDGRNGVIIIEMKKRQR